MSNTVVVLLLVALNGILIKELGYFFLGSKKPSENLKFLEKYMPMLIMVVLVCFLYKDVNYKSYPYGLSEILAGFSALLFYIISKKSYVAILLATFVFYILKEVVL